MQVGLYTDAGKLSSFSASIRTADGKKTASGLSAQPRDAADAAERAAQVEISPAGRQAAQGAEGSGAQQVSGQKAPEVGSVAEEEPVQEAEREMDAAVGKQQKRLVEEEEAEADEAETEARSEKMGGSVAFNAAKRARQLAAAKTAAQVQSVLSLLHQDLSDCKIGAENGMCDENEVAKVEAMLDRAKQRLSEVSRTSDGAQEEGADAFAIASLM